jgi:antitoxin component of RelBE/YafQ-DinJ toxin-antitoxin module
MTTIIINERTAKGKKLLSFLAEFHNEEFIQVDKRPNKETIHAIEASRKGKVTRTKGVADLMKKLNS